MADELVEIDGFSLTDQYRGISWKMLDLEGWWDRPAVKDPPEKKNFGDGSYRVPVQFDERLITISGRLSSRNHDELHSALDLLNGLAYRGNALMTVVGHGVTQSATVDPRGAGVVAKIRSDRYVSYVMQLVATDPFKYGSSQELEVTPGQPKVLFHWGTVEAWPVVLVTGSMSGYRLRFRGVDVHVNTSVSAGQTHRVEYKSRRLYINGQFMMGFFGNTDFRPSEPGLRQVFELIPDSGTGKAVVTVTDTYI